MKRTHIALFCSFVASVAWAQEDVTREVHDPSIIAEKGWYYVFTTGTRGEHIPIRRSKDLRQWEHVGNVFKEMPGWARKKVPKGGLWAPDIAFWKGRYWLYYSVAVNTAGVPSCIGLATNKTLDPASPEYKWEDQGLVRPGQPGRDSFATIDPNFFLKDGKEPWLVFGSTSIDRLRLVRLNDNGKVAQGAALIPVAGRTDGCIEAPYLIQRGEWYYLFVSFDDCCKGVKSTYRIMVGRAKRLEGPYVDFAGRPMLDGNATSLLAGHRDVRGPGHNSVVRVKDQDYLVHHFYDANKKGTPTLQIRPLLWSNDGWPSAGEPGILAEDRPAKAPALTGRWTHSANFEKGFELELLAGGRIGRSGDATWKLSGAVLELRWPHKDAPRGAWVDSCMVSPDGKWYVGRNQQGVVIRGARVGMD